MGKAENIKRAKKLKEAKRQREQGASIAAGLGSSSRILQERNAKRGVETRLNKDSVKYSELLQEFVDPLLDSQNDSSTVKLKFAFGVHAWNAATVREKSEEAYLLAKREFFKTTPYVPGMEQLFEEMVDRKREKFSEHKNIIVDFEIKKIHGTDYHLTVATAPL